MLLELCLAALAVFNVAYGTVYLVFVSIYNKFVYILIGGGFALGLLSFCLRSARKGRMALPHFVLPAVWVCFLVGAAVFALAELAIVRGAVDDAPPGADYVIVLGAQVKGRAPSLAFAARLDRAVEYLAENENTLVIATGGRGSGEDVTEAEAALAYLLARGVDRERILSEDTSVNTIENLVNASRAAEEHAASFGDGETGLMAVMEAGGNASASGGAAGVLSEPGEAEGTLYLADKSVVLISSDYHLYRARALAKKLGYEDVSGLGAGSLWITVPMNYIREACSVIYYTATGRM